jgi:hypothetical protein
VRSGHAITCPAGTRRCTVKATLRLVRNRNGRRVTTYMTAKAIRFTLAPGAKRAITFKLNRSGRRLLRRGPFNAIIRIRIARRGDQPRAKFTPVRVPERKRR